MFQFVRYYGRFQDFRGGFIGLPSWARTIVALFAIPGLILLGLSILAFIVSLFALLLLTLPVYLLLRKLTAVREEPADRDVRRVEVRVIESEMIE